MVRDELDRHVFVLAALTQAIAQLLDHTTRIREHEVAAAAHGPEQVVGDDLQSRRLRVVRRCHTPHTADLHAQLLPSRRRLHQRHRRRVLRSKGRPREIHVAERGAQPDAGHAPPEQEFQPRELRLQLLAALRAEEGVEFVDHHVAQGREDAAQLRTAADEQSLQ